ncbi:MAG: cytosine deaminase [Oscillatoriales cyanobacterium]|uniref:Cytosine deaminase n=1 Tax=Microcoleus anatoxicus PTRS2 TaxID=2705321 RepID=A0ABU8YRU3_9CYAN|nr:MAG: cytosine deaminase [Oscillatoriales cyanobacterium]TAD99943.1 MAG: cytosine deaminase [Oscillatoriales cyanobacterium]
MLPSTSNYLLKNACVPMSLLEIPSIALKSDPVAVRETGEGLCVVDMEISAGAIAKITPSGKQPVSEVADIPVVDCRGGLVWPCFLDIHTHLDKGHIWERAPNPDGTFAKAILTVGADTQKNWNPEDIYRRMEFGIKCSYAHGTKAIRTHIDSGGEQGNFSLAAFEELRTQWGDRLMLQAVSLVSLEYLLTPAGEKLADKMAEIGGILGGVAYINPDLDKQLDRVFALAQERGLNLDFHTDENDDPESVTLRQVAKTAIRHQFPGKIICGHCCSLAVQPPELVTETITLVKEANIGIVSLPMCNLYLQDRQSKRTPRWRGVTLVHELKTAGIPVAFASDNCRDPFYGFGDHDVLEVFNMAVRIAHLDRPYGDWPRAVTKTPADLMGLPKLGRIAVDLPADLILFKARNYSELLSRSQRDRTVLRQGKEIDTTLPDYRELDDLLAN